MYIPINNPQSKDENIFSFSAMKNSNQCPVNFQQRVNPGRSSPMMK
jgi:hypothetical protein